jgi:glycosyltransferase involved in cell wall biosynthesis
MKKGYIKKEDRKTILFLADDMRLPSGIGVMTKELIVNNAHAYNFIHVGSAINHPDIGKILDLSDEINKEVGIDDSSVVIYPYNGYGDPDIVRLILDRYKIDAIVHFTDPRYWIWLYRMSAELRQHVPIVYYHIWDDLPAPHYNKPYYESCDLLMGISKQSFNISKIVLGAGNYVDLDSNPPAELVGKSLPKVSFVPHGINEKSFFPIDRNDERVVAMRKRMFGDVDPKFVLFYNNRNIRRKMTSDAILAFKIFHDKLSVEDQNEVRFVLHTQSADENGTDLDAVIDALCPEISNKILITNTRLTTEELNILYNCCDTTINIASNEGWGLSSTESMLTGTPLINNVTGGLQDQCRFADENGKWIDFNDDFGSNHAGRYKAHGSWVYPVFPAAINIQGSIPTPYIFDDRCDIRDVAKAIHYWFSTDTKSRKECGLAGREWALSDESCFTAEKMAGKFRNSIDILLDNWTPPKRFKLFNVAETIKKSKNKKTGISL